MSASISSSDLPGRGSIGGDPSDAAVHKMPSSSTSGDEDDGDSAFDSPKEEAAHYREKYRRISDMSDETRAESDEFQQSSKESEDESERELSMTEKAQAELKDRIVRLEAEKEEWKAKHIALQRSHSSTVGNMQREMDNLRSERDNTLNASRDLELGNDESERNERVAVSSSLDLESKYNRAIEEKTSSEQEVVQRQELEEENQRLKDDLRDANNEIAILRDQIAKAAVPTPPSSVSVTMSPVREPAKESSPPDMPSRDSSSATPNRSQRPAATPEPPLRASMYLPRSNTSSSIPTMSPSVKRMSMRATDSPNGSSHLARSTTTRNSATHTAPSPGPGSPAPRSRPGSIPPTALGHKPNVDRNQTARTRGFKSLHDLQSKSGTAQTNSARAPKRLASGTMPAAARRTVSGATVKSTQGIPPVQAPEAAHTPIDADKSGTTFLSPNGWVMVSEAEDTPPTRQNPLLTQSARRPEPDSPSVETVVHYRSVSSASTSNKPLPSRPGIPSPLAANSSRSVTSTHLARSGTTRLSRSTRTPNPTVPTGSAQPSRPASRAEGREKGAEGMEKGAEGMEKRASRPMSPSMSPQPARSYLRSPTPTFGQAIASSHSSAAASSAASTRPSSRAGQRTSGRGPPPPAKQVPAPQPQTTTTTPHALRRSGRRSSLGAADGKVHSGIPGPARTPSRPISVHVFDGTPPPVPRIPSAHKRAPSRDQLGVSASSRERTRSMGERI